MSEKMYETFSRDLDIAAPLAPESEPEDDVVAAVMRARDAANVEPKPSIFDKPKTVFSDALSIIVIGASGDLAKKKTFPALFSLFEMGLLPPDVIIAGYARSKLSEKDFREKVSTTLKGKPKLKAFLNRCFYFAGQYNSPDDFKTFEGVLAKREKLQSNSANRLFYLAIPPTLFVDVGKGIQPNAITKTGWNRVIVEKPFGRDSESSKELGSHLSALFKEEQLYRIDHYLGKEMVQNLMTLRFANSVFQPLWNNRFVQAVIITFKEPFGTKGRGGYFDQFGIIRDVLQNHLLQVLALTAMEAPFSLDAEAVRDEKVKLLRCIKPVTRENVVIGQYEADPAGSECSYTEDPTVPDDSVTPTYAMMRLNIDNERWSGVPFILKAGKALDERKAEVRIQFKKPANNLFGDQASNNELVLRLQPNEAVYVKTTTKKPGLEGGVAHVEMDLNYHQRFAEDGKPLVLPDAYAQLIYECVRGDHNLFVRSDELEYAWKIFTPILHELENEKVKPIPYAYGGRGPPQADQFIKDCGYERTSKYVWKDTR